MQTKGATIARYSSHELDPKAYRNKKIAVLGGGNSAFEVLKLNEKKISSADTNISSVCHQVVKSLMSETASIHQFSKRRTMAEMTHYPGNAP